ncbi:MAG TPA: hypothetical protein PKA62_03410, partial [Thermoanaerobaculia bacterium]|nr:hypothetical protein [Thermoanaerobaculia bacterium]
MRRALCTALLLALAASPLLADDAALDLPLGDPARREKTLAPPLDVVLDARTGAAIPPAEYRPPTVDSLKYSGRGL